MDNNEVYLTEEGLNKLKNELKYLLETKRKEVAERIQSAKELGDLSENAEYSDAKDEQAFLEGRIAELTTLTRHAVIIGASNGNRDRVEMGSTVIVEDTVGKEKTYKIVGSQEADPLQGFISNESPIGRVFLGKRKGENIEYQAPKGILRFKILSIK